jgi:hypothetical protein
MRPCPADTCPRFFRFFFNLVVIAAADGFPFLSLVGEEEEGVNRGGKEETLGMRGGEYL